MKKRKATGALEIIVAIAIVIAVIHFSNDIAGLSAYGYAGVFLIALLSAATILFPAPGWAAVIAMSTQLDPLLLGIVAGIGASIGEMTGYMAGDGVRALINNNIKEAKKVEEIVKKYEEAAIFVLALIPNPLFDIGGIIAGGLKMPWWRFLAACAAGRVLRYTILAIMGAFTLGLLL